MRKDNLAKRRNRAVSLMMAGAMALGSLWIGPMKMSEAAEGYEGAGVLTLKAADEYTLTETTLNGEQLVDDAMNPCKATELNTILEDSAWNEDSTYLYRPDVYIDGLVGNENTVVEIIGYGALMYVTNNGTLNAASISGDLRSNEGTINVGSMYAKGTSSGATLRNSGTLKVAGDYTVKDAIALENSGSFSAQNVSLTTVTTLTNTGTFSVSGTMSLFNDGEYMAKVENEGTFEIPAFDSSDYGNGQFANLGTVKADTVTLTPAVMNNEAAVYQVKNSINITGYNSELIGTVDAQPDTMIQMDGGTFTLKVGEETKLISEYLEEPVSAATLMKEEPEFQVDMPDVVYYGVEYDFPSTVTQLTGDGALSFEYAEGDEYGDEFLDPTPDQPVEPGHYRAYIMSEETDSFRPGISDWDFAIEYLDETIDRCTVSGTKSADQYGGADVYTTPVTVTAPEGYEIRWSEDEEGDFAESFVLDEDRYYDGVTVQYRRLSDGAITASKYGYTSAFYVETHGPEIWFSMADGKEMGSLVDDGDTVVARDLEIGLQDAVGIQSITVDGLNVLDSPGSDTASFTLSTPLPGEKTFAVVATDSLGLSSGWTITLEYALVEAPKPAYSISGTKGNGDWYTSTVSLVPAEGYQISDTLGGTYVDELPYDESITEIWLKDKTGGFYTDSAEVDPIQIDTEPPVIYWLKNGVEQPLSNYAALDARTIPLVAEDPYLTSVSVNGLVSEAVSGEVWTTLTSSKTETQTATVVAEDEAGNKTEYVFTYKDSSLVPTCSVSVDDIRLGGTITPVFTSDSNAKGDAVFEYKEDGQADEFYTETEPTEVGDYVIRVTTPETDAYDEGVCTDTFSILKKEASVTITAPDSDYGDSYAVTFDTNSDGKSLASVMYKKQGAADTTYDADPPTLPGTYTVRVAVPVTDTYEAVSDTADFTISRATISATVTVADVVYGEEIAPVVTTVSDGKVTYEYKSAGAPDTAYSGTVPTAVGSYMVRATIAQTEKYEKIVCVTASSFEIKRATTTATVTVEDIVYGETPDPKVTTLSTGTVTFEYKAAADPESAYSSTVPTAVGTYDVRATVAQTDIYEKIVCENSFRITAKPIPTATVTVADLEVGDEIKPDLTTNSDGKDKAVFEYKEFESSGSYSTEEPTLAGKYSIRVTIPETDNFESAECEGTFTISRKTVTASVSVADILVEEAVDPVVTTVSNGTRTYAYKPVGAEDTEYNSDPPTAAGEYSVRATIAETYMYNSIVCENTFTISRKDASATFSAADILVGEDPSLDLQTDSRGSVSYEYKAEGAEDSTYVTEPPTAAGTYVVRATISETPIYNKLVRLATFTIGKRKAEISVFLQSPSAGTAYQPTVSTNSNGRVVLEYRQNTDGSAYSSEPPKQVGNYIVRATVLESETYESASGMAEYTIRYLETPETPYEIQSQPGNNGYYRDDVVLNAPEDYMISASPDSGFAKSLLYVEGMTKVYLKRDSDNALTDEIELGEIRIDKESPKLVGITDDKDNSLTITSGQDVYADSLLISLEDENLVSIRIGNLITKITDGKADIILKADGEIKPITVVAEDIAGNTYEMNFTLYASWRKSDQVPAGMSVTLETGHQYRFGDGSWKVDGDSTVFNGEQAFYVRKTRKYRITQE